MSKTPPNLADLPPDVQAFVAAQSAELARKDAEILGLSLSHATAQKRLKDEMEAALAAVRTAHARAIQNRDTIIADLRLQLHGHKKHRFGSKSESSAQLALELILEELEIEQAAETEGDGEEGVSSEADAPKPPRAPRKRLRCCIGADPRADRTACAVSETPPWRRHYSPPSGERRNDQGAALDLCSG